MKEKKLSIKKWWFCIAILVIVILGTVLVLLTKNDGIGSSGISKKEFEEIELGMSQSKVHRIIDKLNEWDEDEVYKKACEEIEKSQENSKYTYRYKYYGDKSGYAIITYEADYSRGDLFVLPEVVKKEQFNLK